MDVIREFIQGDIDFEGQKTADQLNFYITWASSILAIILGFITQNIYVTAYTSAASLLITLLVLVPAWPFYNKNPVKWQTPPGWLGTVDSGVIVGEKEN